VAGFISEWWPGSNRYGGRIASEFADRTLEGFLLLRSLRARPARGLAIDGDHFGPNSRLRGDPSGKATPECLRVERGQNMADVIVRRRPILEGSEAPEQRQLQPAKLGDIGDRLHPATTASKHGSKISSSGYRPCRPAGGLQIFEV
jgi:hypothetical protein